MKRPRTVLLLLICITAAGCAIRPPVKGLRPEYPEVLYNSNRTEIIFVEVDSLQPMLRWESYPRPGDVGSVPGQPKRISDVTYELNIWKATEGYPYEPVYDREGLAEPSHKVELPLEPSTDYIWTVRARFRLDGRTRVSEWGMSRYPGVPVFQSPADVVPNPNYYRFRTPAE